MPDSFSLCLESKFLKTAVLGHLERNSIKVFFLKKKLKKHAFLGPKQYLIHSDFEGMGTEVKQ